MDILVRIPDDLALRLGTRGEVERRALEALALEEYRLGHLTAPELRRLLAFSTGRTLGGFLQEQMCLNRPAVAMQSRRANPCR